MRVHFVNENIGGHATKHLAIRDALVDHPDVTATFYDAPPRQGLARVITTRVPGLSRLDADFQPQRDQLVRSAIVRRALRTAPPSDVLHVYTQNAALLSAGHLRSQPSVISTDATNELLATKFMRPPRLFTGAAVAALRPLERRVFRTAHFVVAQTEWAARSIVDDYDIDPAKVCVIPFGIAVPPEVEHRPDVPRITFIGRSLERKGGNRLLDVWRRHLRSDVTLTLVTQESVPAEPGLEVRNDITPGDPALQELLGRTTVLAFPTEIDTFGYAAIEAMAAGVPVVSTRCGGVVEVVDHEVTGLLVEMRDDDGLRQALERILGDESLRARMGAAGRRRVLERFDARVTTAALLDVLRQAATTPAP